MYQLTLGCVDHVFIVLYYAICKKYKTTLFLNAIDFDGAFSCVSHSLLVLKLGKFSAGSIFTAYITSIYTSTDKIILRESEFVTYKLFSEITPVVPLLY